MKEHPDSDTPQNQEAADKTQPRQNREAANPPAPKLPVSDPDDLDFVVTEANDDTRRFAGEGVPGIGLPTDELGIQATSDLLGSSRDDEAAGRPARPNKPTYPLDEFEYAPIGQTAPPPPPQPEEPEPKAPAAKDEATIPNDQLSASGRIKRLSADELKKIEENLYGANRFLNKKESDTLRSKLSSLEPDAAGSEATPGFPSAAPVRPGRPASETFDASEREQSVGGLPVSSIRQSVGDVPMAQHKPAIAYFYRQYIEVTGAVSLHYGDTFDINGRTFVLRPKKIKPVYTYAGLAVAAALILIAVISLAVPSISHTEAGIVGIVLSDSDQPYIQGATVRLPELGQAAVSNAQGFFVLPDVPVGTHKIEYVVAGEVVGVDYVTTSDDPLRLVVLRPETEELAVEIEPPVQSQKTAVTETPAQQTSASARVEQPAKSKTSSTSTSSRSTKSSSKSAGQGKVTLAANIPAARFEIDGQVLGAGNLTYDRIASGKHDYRVSADGYIDEVGSIVIKDGETHSLIVQLEEVAKQTASAAVTEDPFRTASIAFEQGDYEQAIADLSQYLRDQPQDPRAYESRGQAFLAMTRDKKAAEDFARAGELYLKRGKFDRAAAAYSAILEIQPDQVPALLGRGAAYRGQKQYEQALADFETVSRYDKRSFEAYYGMGLTHYEAGDYKRAIRRFRDARTVDETDPRTYQYLMLAYFAEGEHRDVERTYSQFTEVASDEEVKKLENDAAFSEVLKAARKN